MGLRIESDGADNKRFVPVEVGWGRVWLCVHKDITEQEFLRHLTRDLRLNGLFLGDLHPEILADRCFGGFQCGDNAKHRHVAFENLFDTVNPKGPSNGPIPPEQRKAVWALLHKQHENTPGGFIGGGPFCNGGDDK